VVASSPPVQPVLRVLVQAGMTAGQALRDGGAPTTGPDAIVVARDAQGGLRDLADSATPGRIGVAAPRVTITPWLLHPTPCTPYSTTARTTASTCIDSVIS